MARQRRQGQGGEQGGGPAPDVSAALAMVKALEQQAAAWDQVGRKQRDAAYDMVLFNRAQDAARDQADKLAKSTNAVTLAYAAFSGGLIAWTRAGLAGTTAGAMLSYQQNQLSQQVASIFLPLVQRYTEALGRLVTWFRSLSGEQQAQVQRWSLFTAGLLGSVTVVPRLTAAFGTLGMTLKGLTLANPFAALTAAVIGLMAQTEEGRQSLSALGQTLSEAFGKVAGAVSDVAGPALQGLADFVSSAPGQWIAWGTIAVSVLYRIAAAGKGAATAFLGWGTALGAIALLLGGVVMALSKTEDASKKTLEGIGNALRSGRITREQAQEQVRQEAEEAGREAERRARTHPLGTPGVELGMSEEEATAAAGRYRREEVLKKGREEIERSARGRQDVQRVGAGPEDPRATIRRLEQASLRTGVDSGERTARNTDELLAIIRRINERFGFRADNREQTPKAD